MATIKSYTDLSQSMMTGDRPLASLATPKEYLLLQHGEHPFLNDYGRLASLGDYDYRGLHRVIGNVIENPELYKYESV